MKNLVICLDGTFNGMHTVSPHTTNIAFIADAAGDTDSGNPQMPNQVVHYEDGVGVGSLVFDKYISGAFGYGVFTQARRAWKFIKLNYQIGDKIFIFGFSRGAYAAKQLASMIVHCGVGNTLYDNLESDYRAWFKLAGTHVESPRQMVEFLGLFDCVPGNRFTGNSADRARLNSPDLEAGIKHFRHALARDERRWSFSPIVFRPNTATESFQQIVFPGFHCDVGGGGLSTEGLSTVPMWWIMREAYGLGAGFRMLQCTWKHREGPSTFIGNLNLEAKSVRSDYPWTRWLHYTRTSESLFASLPTAPDVFSMDACPLCGLAMF